MRNFLLFLVLCFSFNTYGETKKEIIKQQEKNYTQQVVFKEVIYFIEEFFEFKLEIILFKRKKIPLLNRLVEPTNLGFPIGKYQTEYG